MREILFRGKMKKDGTGCYGNLCVACGDKYIVSADVFPLSIHGEVNPETVGQFTGLTDKNGVKIFEGDIVKLSRYSSPGKVEWSCGLLGFFVKIYGEYISLAGYLCKHLDVIGNIHDTPELLKGDVSE